MQQKNDFQAIRNTWRRLSGEKVKPAPLGSMSGDSSSHPTKIEEDVALLVPENKTPVVIASLEAGASAVSQETQTIQEKKDDEKQEFLNSSGNHSKDAAVDTNKTENNGKKDDQDNNKDDAAGDANKTENNGKKDDQENDEDVSKPSNTNDKSEKVSLGDNVDSVYIGQRPSHKTRSAASSEEEEDCGIKCLSYTLQCCDCVLM